MKIIKEGLHLTWASLTKSRELSVSPVPFLSHSLVWLGEGFREWLGQEDYSLYCWHCVLLNQGSSGNDARSLIRVFVPLIDRHNYIYLGLPIWFQFRYTLFNNQIRQITISIIWIHIYPNIYIHYIITIIIIYYYIWLCNYISDYIYFNYLNSSHSQMK